MAESRKKLVCVAGPISKGNLTANVMRAHQAGMALLRAGLSVIVPHGNCFWGNLVVHGTERDSFVPESQPGGTTHADWMGCDLEIVRRCDAVLRLPGESVGADMEVAEARKSGVEVFYTATELILWARGSE